MTKNEIKDSGRTFPPNSENNSYLTGHVKYRYTLLNVNPGVCEEWNVSSISKAKISINIFTNKHLVSFLVKSVKSLMHMPL